MVEYIDLTWIMDLNQLVHFRQIQRDYNTGLQIGVIKINTDLENAFKSNLAEPMNCQKLTKLWDWDIYEEEDWEFNKAVGYGNEIVLDDVRTLKEKINLDIVDLKNGYDKDSIRIILDRRFGF